MQKQMRGQRGAKQRSSWLIIGKVGKLWPNRFEIGCFVWKCDARLELRAFVRGLEDSRIRFLMTKNTASKV